MLPFVMPDETGRMPDATGRGGSSVVATMASMQPFSSSTRAGDQLNAGTAQPDQGQGVTERGAARSWRWLDIGVALTTLCAVLIFTSGRRHAVPLGEFLAMRVTVKNILLLMLFGASWEVSFRALGLYGARLLHGTTGAVLNVTVACGIGSIALLAFPLLTHGHGALWYASVLCFWLAVVPATIIARCAANMIVRAMRRTVKRVIIIGKGPRGSALARQLRADPHTRYEILGFIDTPQGAMLYGGPEAELGSLDDLEQTLMHTVVDEVMIALPVRSHYAAIESVIRACEGIGVQSRYLADIFDPWLARPQPASAGAFLSIAMKVVQDDYRLVIKRGFDILAVVLAAPVLVPLAGVIAAAVKLSSPGPVIFRQERYGLHKRRFLMYKFRTMVTGAEAMLATLESRNEANGPVFKIRKDPRVTRLGRFLRRTSLDELPQFWNVLRGEMSLVGPRPLAVRDVTLFSEAWLMRRFSVQPGLTGLWQVSGRSNLEFGKWVELDLRYIDHWSLWLDMAILARTVPAVLRGTGAA